MKKILAFFGYYHINDISKASVAVREGHHKEMFKVTSDIQLGFYNFNREGADKTKVMNDLTSNLTKIVSYNFSSELYEKLNNK